MDELLKFWIRAEGAEIGSMLIFKNFGLGFLRVQAQDWQLSRGFVPRCASAIAVSAVFFWGELVLFGCCFLNPKPCFSCAFSVREAAVGHNCLEASRRDSKFRGLGFQVLGV